MLRRFAPLLCTLPLVLFGTTLAQPLATYAPADAIATLGWSAGSSVLDTLATDLDALEWGRVRETYARMVAALSGTDVDLDPFGTRESFDNLLLESCPSLETDLEALERLQETPFEVLLTVGVSPFNPVPAVTGLFRLVEEDASILAEFQETLLACAQASVGEELTQLEQDGVPLYVVGDGGDLPLVVGNIDNLFFFSTTPEAARGVVRRVQGSDEASLADTALYARTAEILAGGGNRVSLSLDFATLAELAGGFGGFFIDGPETEHLLDRGLAALRTLGGYAGAIRITSEGLVFENVTAVNPAGGDAELASLLLCETCSVSRPFLAPVGSVSATSIHLPLQEIFDYLQGWLDGAELLLGEPLDLSTVLLEEFGFDIDRGLFDWLGSEMHTVVLKPISADLETLLYGRQQVWAFPASDADAAGEGLEALAQMAPPLFENLYTEALLEADLPPELLSEGAVTQESYEGVTITRYRSGFNTDIGWALLDNYLLVGTPGGALEAVIDTYGGERRSLVETPAYREAMSALPPTVVARGWGDTQAQLSGWATLLDTFSQPLAFGITAALSAEDSFDDYNDTELDFGGDLGYADTSGLEATPLNAPTALEDTLTEDDLDTYGNVSTLYDLRGLNPGDEVTVVLESDLFDTYLYLIDKGSDLYLDANDDAPDTSRSELVFSVEEGVTYWLEVTSYSGYDTGDYRLDVSVVPGEPLDIAESLDVDELLDEEAKPVPAPTYADLLHLTDTLSDALRVVAEHVGDTSSYVEVQGNTVYRRVLVRVDW